jgi:serine/threonine-protein kinase
MLVQGGFYGRYLPSGHIVYAHAGSLMAVPFDSQRLEVTGSPVPVQEGVVTTATTSGGAEYDVSGSGLLAYVPTSARPPVRPLVWVDRTGRETNLPVPQGFYSTPRLSPDGRLLAFVYGGDNVMNSPDIYVYDFARKTLNRLTFGPGINGTPLWSPDGRKIFYRTRTSFSFRSKPADGSGKEEVLLGQFDDPGATPFAVSPDGKTMVFGARSSVGKSSFQELALDGTGKIQTLLESTSELYGAQFSPDGRWLAYCSAASGRPEIYVQPFPGAGGEWIISREGGRFARWARNGREIFFMNGDKMMSAAVQTEATFRAETPRLLFQASVDDYDVAPDGQHFLMLKPAEATGSPTELNLALNWLDELKRRVPARTK